MQIQRERYYWRKLYCVLEGNSRNSTYACKEGNLEALERGHMQHNSEKAESVLGSNVGQKGAWSCLLLSDSIHYSGKQDFCIHSLEMKQDYTEEMPDHFQFLPQMETTFKTFPAPDFQLTTRVKKDKHMHLCTTHMTICTPNNCCYQPSSLNKMNVYKKPTSAAGVLTQAVKDIILPFTVV